MCSWKCFLSLFWISPFYKLFLSFKDDNAGWGHFLFCSVMILFPCHGELRLTLAMRMPAGQVSDGINYYWIMNNNKNITYCLRSAYRKQWCLCCQMALRMETSLSSRKVSYWRPSSESLPRNCSHPKESSFPRYMPLPGAHQISWLFPARSQGLAPSLKCVRALSSRAPEWPAQVSLAAAPQLGICPAHLASPSLRQVTLEGTHQDICFPEPASWEPALCAYPVLGIAGHSAYILSSTSVISWGRYYTHVRDEKNESSKP